MRSKRDILPLFVAIIFIGIASGLLSLIALQEVAYELLQITTLIAGAAFFSGLSLLLGLPREPRSAPLMQITFNPNDHRRELGDLIDAEFHEIRPENTTPWEPTADRLATEDPVLAIAKVRIDFEREVRWLAIASGAVREDQRLDMSRTLERLADRKILPGVAIAAIRDIMSVGNRAIHGEAVDVETARNVIDLARDVMIILQSKH